MIHVAIPGVIHGATTQGKGREGIGREKEAEVVIHPQPLGDRLTALPCPAMNELRR